ncbi:unnamed protein product [Caenorhabditis auriculariae]|uniref:Uncharacterized protein n=1 Tax=Caenorhabditis auriculariae TaxID=2777116 RepID=A0A8S1H3L4_9PELO|nr:unnamed protein product [Caenorhabditis auriculariae]
MPAEGKPYKYLIVYPFSVLTTTKILLLILYSLSLFAWEESGRNRGLLDVAILDICLCGLSAISLWFIVQKFYWKKLELIFDLAGSFFSAIALISSLISTPSIFSQPNLNFPPSNPDFVAFRVILVHPRDVEQQAHVDSSAGDSLTMAREVAGSVPVEGKSHPKSEITPLCWDASGKPQNRYPKLALLPSFDRPDKRELEQVVLSSTNCLPTHLPTEPFRYPALFAPPT